MWMSAEAVPRSSLACLGFTMPYGEDAQQVLQTARRSLKQFLEDVDCDAKPPKSFSRCNRDDLLRFCCLARCLLRCVVALGY